MFNDERGKSEGGMVYGSTQSGLFSTGGADPRTYVGAPVPRRVRAISSKPATPGKRASTPSGVGGKGKRTSSTGPGSRASTSHGHRPESETSASRSRSVLAPYVRDNMLINSDEPGTKSLANFDCNRRYKEGELYLDSPRSVQACLEMGIMPKDLFVPSYQDCLDRMKEKGESTADAEVCKLRYKYHADNAKRMYKGALQQRETLVMAEVTQKSLDAGNETSATSTGGVDNSTMVANEERRLQKIVDTNLSRLRQQLLHRELLQRQRSKEDTRLEQQRREDEQRKANEIVFLAERSRKEEEAQSLRNEARELDRLRQAAEIELKRAKYEEKDLNLKERMRQKQIEKEAMNEAKKLHNTQRRKQMKEQAETLLGQRRVEFESRWEKFEADREAFQRHRQDVARQRRIAAELKQEKIEVALVRSEEILDAKIKRTEDREAKADAMLKQFQEEREAHNAAQQSEENAKHRLRKKTYEEAQLRLQERSVRFTNRIRQAEARLQRQAEEEAHQMRIRHEEQREVELDKQMCVERSKRIDEARRARLQSNIDRKNARADADKEKRVMLAARRRRHREEVERSRVHVDDVTPGSGDYLVTEGSVGTEGPRWKFGLPASVMGQRTVIRNQPPSGYVASPGPGVYKADTEFYARHRKQPTPVFGRMERWEDPANAAITPGPADYAPKVDDPLLEAHHSQQRARSQSPAKAHQ